jgi:dihydrofolate reductase
MRNLIYYIATTLDGFIAHEDGSFDGFSWDDEFIAYQLSEFPETIPAHLKEKTGSRQQNKVFDTVLMGRKTYEIGLDQGITNPYPMLDQYVFSRTMDRSPDKNITLISENTVETVQSLKNKPGEAIWLCGGAELAGQMLEENLIDSLIVKLNPVVFGSGIPLFSGYRKQSAFALTDSKSFKSSHILLYYDVK